MHSADQGLRGSTGPSFRRSALVVVGAAAAACRLVGCAPYSAPSLTIADVHSVQETDAGLALAITVLAQNPNQVPLPLRSAEYRLEVGDPAAAGQASPDSAAMRTVFEGVRSPEATLTRESQHQVILPAVIRLRDAAGSASPRPVGVHPFRFWVTLTYVTPGALAETLFDTGVRRPTVTISQTGELDFGGGPGAAVTLVRHEPDAPSPAPK